MKRHHLRFSAPTQGNKPCFQCVWALAVSCPPHTCSGQYPAECLAGTCAISRVIFLCSSPVFSMWTRLPLLSAGWWEDSTPAPSPMLQTKTSLWAVSWSSHTAQVLFSSYSRPEGSLLLRSAWNPPSDYLIQILLKVNVTVSFLGNIVNKSLW